MARSATSKSERINLRLDAAAKHKIEQAASVEGKTVSGFILTSALTCADEATPTVGHCRVSAWSASPFATSAAALARPVSPEHRPRRIAVPQLAASAATV